MRRYNARVTEWKARTWMKELQEKKWRKITFLLLTEDIHTWERPEHAEI
jgi:hypothetical protein